MAAPSTIASRLLRRSAFNCPACRAIIESSLPSCPRCGFHYGTISHQIPGPPPTLEGLMDFAQVLPQQNPRITSELHKLQTKFPQLALSICLVNCPPQLPPNLLAMWMLNETADAFSPWRGLLLIDPTMRTHAFASGYQLETFLSRRELENILDQTGQFFFNQDWHNGITTFLELLDQTLTQACKIAHQTVKEARKAIKQ